MYSRSIPFEIFEQLDYAVARDDLEYADNYRAYRIHDEYLKEDFDEAEASGCCGSAQYVFKDNDGHRWTVGCNYGH